MIENRSTVAGRRFVAYSLRIGAMELIPEGRKLKSGRLSPYFFNAGLFNTGEALRELAAAYAAAIKPLSPEVIFGPAYKGIPIAVSIAFELGGNVGWAFNRKEAKDHGEGGIIVGHSLTGKRVVAGDDVITTSLTARELVKIVRGAGGELVGYSIAFDRQERGTAEDGRSGAAQVAEEFGIPVIAASALDDLVVVLDDLSSQKAKDALKRILDYRAQFGV